MDEHFGTILEIAGGIIVFVYGGVLVWITKRLLKLENEMKGDLHEAAVEIAVMERGQKDLIKEWERSEKRNTAEHEKILNRLDRVLMVVKNGG